MSRDLIRARIKVFSGMNSLDHQYKLIEMLEDKDDPDSHYERLNYFLIIMEQMCNKLIDGLKKSKDKYTDEEYLANAGQTIKAVHPFAKKMVEYIDELSSFATEPEEQLDLMMYEVRNSAYIFEVNPEFSIDDLFENVIQSISALSNRKQQEVWKTLLDVSEELSITEKLYPHRGNIKDDVATYTLLMRHLVDQYIELEEFDEAMAVIVTYMEELSSSDHLAELYEFAKDMFLKFSGEAKVEGKVFFWEKYYQLSKNLWQFDNAMVAAAVLREDATHNSNDKNVELYTTAIKELLPLWDKDDHFYKDFISESDLLSFLN